MISTLEEWGVTQYCCLVNILFLAGRNDRPVAIMAPGISNKMV